MSYIGGNQFQQVRLKVKGRPITVRARLPVYGMDVGVVQGVDDPSFLGFLLVGKWEEVQRLLLAGVNWRTYKWSPEDHTYQMVASLYHAIRQVHHILGQYGLTLQWGERALLRSAFEASERLDNLLVSGSNEAFKESLASYTSRVDQLVDSLGVPRNLAKSEAQDKLVVARRATDRFGRQNPQATRSRIRAASRRLLERMDQIGHIEPYLLARQQVLLGMRQMAEWHVITTYRLCFKLADAKTIDGLSPENRQLVAARLDQAVSILQRIDFNPYRRNCKLTAADLAAARIHLQSGHTPEFLEAIARCCHALRLKQIQTEVERAIFLLTNAEKRGWRSLPKTALPKAVGVRRDLRQLDLTGFKEIAAVEEARGDLINRAIVRLRSLKPESLAEARELLKQVSDRI